MRVTDRVPPTIGIDVGGTKIAAGVVDGDGTIVARTRIPTESDDPGATVAGIAKVANELRAAAPAAAALGIGAAALISDGVILGAPNLAWRNLDLRTVVQERIGLPTAVDNDANVAALAEATYGAGRGARHVVMVTVGTGIGGGLVLDGRIYRGAHGVGAELGHMVIDPDGPQCPCGNVGCLEALASGNAIGRVARDRASGDRGRALLELAGGDRDAIVGEHVAQAARAGDPLAVEILAEIGRWLGIGLANFVNIFDPEVVVIGGGAAVGSGDLLLEPARTAMQRFIVEAAARPPVRLVRAELAYEAGVIGAACLARTLLHPAAG